MHIYYHDYKTLMTPISIDTELGFNLKDANDPNNGHDAYAIHIYRWQQNY